MSRKAEFLRICLAIRELESIKEQHPDVKLDNALTYLEERKIKVEPMKLYGQLQSKL